VKSLLLQFTRRSSIVRRRIFQLKRLMSAAVRTINYDECLSLSLSVCLSVWRWRVPTWPAHAYSRVYDRLYARTGTSCAGKTSRCFDSVVKRSIRCSSASFIQYY